MSTTWQLPATAYQRLDEIILGGSIIIKATRDLTCELPITIISDATDTEVFISVSVLTTRKTTTLQITDNTYKNELTNQAYNFVVDTLAMATAKEVKSA